MNKPAVTPDPPYYAVIFSPVRSGEDSEGYQRMAEHMVELAMTMPGFLGIEHGEGLDGFGITVSYWRDEAAIKQWYENAEHRAAQARGKSVWYRQFELRVAKVERAYGFTRSA